MGLAEKLYCAIMDVGYFAKKNKTKNSLAKTMFDIARSKNGVPTMSMKLFATGALANDDLPHKSWDLDEDTSTAL